MSRERRAARRAAIVVPAAFVSGLAINAVPVAHASEVQGIEEVVVTATRREEHLQDVPVAVSAISSQTLSDSGMQNLQDIQYLAAGVQFGSAPNDSGFRLRGVGNAGGFTSSSEQNVGVFVDNVAIPFGNPVSSLGDIERVEVLKGPQGTQFGKNASSGVINITTKRPSLDGYSVKLSGSYATLDEVSMNGLVNVPIGSTAAASVFAFHRAHDGYVKNVTRGETWGDTRNSGFRAKLLLQPSEAFSAYLIADWAKFHRQGPNQLWTLNIRPPSTPLMNARFGNLPSLGITPGFDNDKTAEEYESYSDDENYGASLELNFRLGEYDLTSVTAYRRLDEKLRPFAIDGSSAVVFTSQQAGTDESFYSEELRLVSPDSGALQYTAGLYFSRRATGDDGDYNTAQLRPAAPLNPFIVSISNGRSTTQTDSDSAAVFFDGTFAVADRLRLIGGLRYQYDSVESLSYSVIDPNFAPAPPGPPRPGVVNFYTPRPLATGKTSGSDWSGRFGFDFKASDDLMFFATVARGYLGPTVTFSGQTGIRTNVAPQTVNDVTIGLKSQFLDRRLTFNANLFFDRYKDLQTSVFNGLEFLTENAGGFDAKGIEFDASWRLHDMVEVHGSFTYSDTEFTDYVTACPASVTAQGATAIAATCNAPGSTPATPLFQAKGEPLSGAPKYSGTLGIDFKRGIGAGLELDASANYYYRSRVQYTVANPFSAQPGYDTVGLNVGVGSADGRWRVAAFARNLFDQRFHAAIITLPFNDNGGYVNWNTREGRRTVGIAAELNF